MSVNDLLSESNLDLKLLESIDIGAAGDEFGQWYKQQIQGIQYDIIKLENGAEAMFYRPSDLD